MNNSDPAAVDYTALPRCPSSGVFFGVTEIPANYQVPMYRTISLDYAAVLSGEIVCELDGGEEKTIQAGDCIIQQGTNHQWLNRTENPCRILFVTVGAEKVVLQDGNVLGETVKTMEKRDFKK